MDGLTDDQKEELASVEATLAERNWKPYWKDDDPRHYLLEYQAEVRNAVLGDPEVPGDTGEDHVLWAASRRSGKDHTMTEVGVEDCSYHSNVLEKSTKWTFGAPSERQSKMTVEMAKVHATSWEMIVDDVVETKDESNGVLINSTEIKFMTPKGVRGPVSSIICIPGKPETTRGLDTNVALTECEFFEKPKETWRALAPSILNKMSGVKKKIVCYSSVAGLDGILRLHGGEAWDAMDHEGWATNEKTKMKWRLFKTTIEYAVRLGLQVDLDECKGLFIGDDDGYAAEFMCQFLDSAAILFPYETLLACENPMATTTAPPDFWDSPAQKVGGLDFARVRHLSVLWTNELIGDYQMTRDIDCVQKMSTPDQIRHFGPKIDTLVRCCVDYTGPGIGFGDLAVEKWGEWKPAEKKFGKIELFNFTPKSKAQGFQTLATTMANKLIGLPKDFETREDLHSVYRMVSGGQVTYGAPTTPGGHADRASALMLADRAASFGGGTVNFFKSISKAISKLTRRDRQRNRSIS